MSSSLRRPNPIQVALACGVFALALALGWGPVREWARMRPAQVVELRSAQTVLLEPGGDPRRFPPWPEELARQLFPIDDAATFDPWCGFRHASNLDMPQRLAEYPGGHFNRRTNSLGLREDAELPERAPQLRILVTGDSHTDGVCANSEGFANLLEHALGLSIADAAPVDVINAGKGGFSFCNYYGVLARFLELGLAPDVFVIAVYGGNDFEEILQVHYATHGGVRPPGKALYGSQIMAAKRVSSPALAQGLISVKYFARQPEQKHVAVGSALEWLDRTNKLARSRGIEFVVVYLPSWFEAAAEIPPMEELLKALELTRADLHSTTELADSLLAGLDARGVQTLDLRAEFRAAGAAAYWKADLHISLVGQRIVAAALEHALPQHAREKLFGKAGSTAADGAAVRTPPLVSPPSDG